MVFGSLSALLHRREGGGIKWFLPKTLFSREGENAWVMAKFWVRDAPRANGSGLPTWHTSCMPAWGKTSDKKTRNREGTCLPSAKSKKKKKKKKKKTRLDLTNSESWPNGSSHIPNSFEALGFQRCLTALEEDVPPNFSWHLIYLKSFENPAFTIRHQPKASLLFWNTRCLHVNSRLAVNHIHRALEATSPVRQPAAPCAQLHRPEFLSSWNQLTLFFLIKPSFWTEVSFFTPKSGTFPARCKVQYLFTLLDK